MTREITIVPRKPGEPPVLGQGPVTILAHGQMRSGKTRFAATMPRPVIFAEDTENGWETIQSMDPGLWWEPDRPPLVWTIQEADDIPKLVARARPLIAKGEIQSVVGDSVTFLADMYLAWITRQMGGDPMKVDNRRVFGRLGERLRELRVQVHSLGVHTMWTALSTSPTEEQPQILPMIPGAQGMKFGAGCNYILYFERVFAARGMSAPQNYYDIHTRTFGKAVAGGRDSGILPDPLPGNTFRDFLMALQNTRGAMPTLTPHTGYGQVTDPAGSVSPATKGPVAPRFKAPSR